MEKVYQSTLLRRSFREDGKVRNETVANLSSLPAAAITAVRSVLAGRDLVDAASVVSINRSVPHGHVAAVWAMAQQLGLPALLGPAGRMRDLALALIISRAVAPASKLATLTAWDDVTLGPDLAVAGASTDEVYAALDYLLARQDTIEKSVGGKVSGAGGEPGSRMALYDLSSSWMTGTKCPLAKRGYSRDGKKGLPQIEYALLTDPAGCPVAVRVFGGNTADPTAFTAAVTAVKDTFALENMVMVGDRGMITTARITALKETRWAGLGDRVAGPADRRAGRRYRAAADDPVRRAELRRDHATPTTPANASSPAATPPWPTCGPINGPSCWRPPKRCSPRSWRRSRRAGWSARTRSGCASGRSSAATKWPNTSTSTITDTTLTITRNQPNGSTPKPHSTAST